LENLTNVNKALHSRLWKKNEVARGCTSKENTKIECSTTKVLVFHLVLPSWSPVAEIVVVTRCTTCRASSIVCHEVIYIEDKNIISIA